MTITINSGQKVSSPSSRSLTGASYTQLETGAFTTADVTFEAQGKDGAWKKIYVNNNGTYEEYTLKGVKANTIYQLDLTLFYGLNVLRMLTSVNQSQKTTVFINERS